MISQKEKTSMKNFYDSGVTALLFHMLLNFLHAFFSTQHFNKHLQAKIGKNQAKVKQHPEAELSIFENYSFSSSSLSTKNNRNHSKKCTKNKCVCFNGVMTL